MENKNNKPFFQMPEWLKWVDWHSVGLYLLVAVIATIGAGLMYMSILALTGILWLAIFAPAFSEAGALAWKIVNERPASSARQVSVSNTMTWVHVIASGLFMFLNMLREIIEYFASRVSGETMQITGIMWGIVVTIAIIGMADLVMFLIWRESDNELASRREHANAMREIEDNVRKARREAKRDSETAKAQAIAEYWRREAPVLARQKGEIEAREEIERLYGKKAGPPNPQRGQ